MPRTNQALGEVNKNLCDIKKSLGRSATADAQNQGFTNVSNDIHREGQAVLAALSAGLDRLSGENRELRELVRLAAADLAGARREVQGVRTEIETLRYEAAEARAAALQPPSDPPPAEPPTPGDDGDGNGDGNGNGSFGHDDLLDAAGGISHADLTCHRDTWSFIVEQAGRNPHFTLSVDIDEDHDGTIDVGISGRSLIAVIAALWNTRTGATGPETRSFAATLYRRIGLALTQDDTGSEHEDGENIHIVIDDRTPPRNRPAAEGDQGGQGDEGDGVPGTPRPDGDAPHGPGGTTG